VLTVVASGDLVTSDTISNLAASPAAVLYATLGALVVRRARNVIGWFLLAIGASLAVVAAASAYGVQGIGHPGSLPAPKLVGLLAEWTFVPLFALIIFMLLLFPTGTLPSPRWRPLAALALLATALLAVGFVVHPRMVVLPAPGGESLAFANPLGIESLGPVLSTVLVGTLNGLAAVDTVLLAAVLVSLVVRYRSDGRDVRQQIKWITLAAVVIAVAQLVGLLASVTAGTDVNPVTDAAYVVVPLVALFGIPAVITVAILKHGLYQIDVIINRAIRYGLLSAALTAIYVVIVVGIGTLAGYVGGPLLNAAAAVAVAVLFQPLRHRAQLAANRVVYGQRATPYQVLSDFAQDMAGQLDADTALDRMASVLAGATGAVRVEVWVRVGAQLQPRVTWPHGTAPSTSVLLAGDAGLPEFGTTRASAVRHGDELLGAITLQKPRDEPMSAAEDRLLSHLASQAGLVLRNVRLTAELHATIDDLTASRRRLVKAQDEERHRIERNLHDGAQQQLVALTIQLNLLEDAAGPAAEIREMTGELRAGLHAALDDLRALARGIYPPLLADQGLGTALRSQAGKAPLPVLVEADGIGRYPADTEAATYFCILEALQNVAKYAQASQATVALSGHDGRLGFTVTDDGIGFDPSHTHHGTGLQGMADRLAALGGSLQLISTPGHGTTVSGMLPVAEPRRPAADAASRGCGDTRAGRGLMQALGRRPEARVAQERQDRGHPPVHQQFAGEVQLAEDRVDVLLHRGFRQRQPLRDAGVAAALRHLPQHLQLPGGEPGQRGLAQPGAPGHQRLDDFRVDDRTAGRRLAQRLK
jgi:signal transduction histidine kinase